MPRTIFSVTVVFCTAYGKNKDPTILVASSEF